MYFRDRVLEFEGAYNVRDLGGLATADGGEIRTGHVFRADSPRSLTDRDRAKVARLGVRHVVDLRSGPEAHDGSWAVAAHMQRRGFPVIDPAELDESIVMPAELDEMGFADRYLRRLTVSGPVLADAARAVVNGADEGVIVNCTAGKDRTGLLAAFLLTALGVEREVVVADYAASTEPLRRMVAARGVTPQSWLMYESPAPVMERLLELADEHLGGIVASFQSHGVTDDDLDRLRDRLLA